MTKTVLVETTGPFQLVDFSYAQQMVHFDRPSVIKMTTFLQGRVALGQVVVHGEVNDQATDAEFAGYWREDAEGAIADFLGAFAVVAETTKVEPEKPKRKPRGA